MDSCCRVCLETNTTLISLQTVVDFAGTKVTCMQMYQSVIKYEELEELLHISQNVCIACFGELNNCYKFQQKAIESFEMLSRNIFEQHKETVEIERINTQERLTSIELLELECKTISDANPKTQLTYVDDEYIDIDILDGAKNSKHETIVAEYKCDVCSHLFNSQTAFDLHFILEHCERTNNGDLICPVCRKLFRSRKTLRQHSRIHQKPESRKFKCRFCTKAFNYGHHLRIHETTHTKEKPFSCSMCKKEFASKDRLTNHQLQHVNDVKQNCDSCSCSFKSKKALKMHCIIKHDAVVLNFDPIKCDKCDKTLFSQSAASFHFKNPCGFDVNSSLDSEVPDERRKEKTRHKQRFRSLKSHTVQSKALSISYDIKEIDTNSNIKNTRKYPF